MTLCLAQSLIDRRGFDAQDQVRKYIACSQEGYMSSMPDLGCFDIGIGTHAALKAWDAHFKGNGYGKPVSQIARVVMEEGQRMIDSLFGKESYCGNGSLMRVVPIALGFYGVGVDKAIQYARLSSKVTHPHLRCQEACALYTQLVIKALQGAEKRTLVETIASANIQDDQLQDRLSRYKTSDSWVTETENNIRSTGYVIDTLEAALWAFFTTDIFEKGAIRVVNLGHDADTVGAVYGGLAGAFYGFNAIPTRWMDAMRNKDLLYGVSEQLQAISGDLAQEKGDRPA